MAQQFGNTWWGNEWLRSLTHIDYENRIPRGARYARNGSVREIQLQDNVISAKVQGSRPRPYRVKIIVPKFSARQVDKLMDRLVARPGIISGLLNRELDPEVLDIARSCGLKIFPERWDDLEMDCSCPDGRCLANIWQPWSICSAGRLTTILSSCSKCTGSTF